MNPENTSVRITIHKKHETQYLQFLNRSPDDRDDLAHPDRLDLTFDEWSSPECEQFHCPGVPFVGYHGPSETFEAHRMCGDGETCMELYADREEHLYILVDEKSGLPNWESSDAVHAFLSLENESLERMKSLQLASVR